MSQISKIILTVIITAVLVGGVVYYWQEQKIKIPLVQIETPKSIQNNEDTPIQFDTMEKYVELVLDMNTKFEYKTTKPSDYDRVHAGSGDLNVHIPSGIAPYVFVLAKSDWDTGNPEDVQTFYLEVFGPLSCQSEMDCFQPNVTQFYGSFQGKLKKLLLQ